MLASLTSQLASSLAAAALSYPGGDQSGAPCVLKAEEVQAAMAQWLPAGGVTIVTGEGSGAVAGGCDFNVPDGSFTAKGNGMTNVSGTDHSAVRMRWYSYASNQIVGSGTLDVDREFGGSTPAAVFGSAGIAMRDVGMAGGSADTTIRYPEIGGGAVSDGLGGFVLAGNQGYWYDVQIVGIKQDPAYNDSMVSLARTLSEQG